MTAFTQQEIDALYAPFPLADHLTREGNKSKSGKIQWFTYIDRAAVQRRLEKLFPGEWSLDVMETYRAADYIAITLKLTIRGVSRSCNGGQSLKFDKDSLDEDKEKGAWTEAFRRVASVWGIGLYLYEMDYRIWTDGYEAGNWDQQRQRESEAKGKFAEWYSRQFPQQNGVQRPAPNADVPPTSQPSTNGSGASKPATPKNAAPKAPPAPVVKNDTKIEMLDRVTIEKFGRDKSRLKTSTGSYSYTRAPFTAAGIDTELWTEPGLYLFGKPFNVISIWHQPEDAKSQAYWRVDRLEAVGEAEAELFGQAPVIEGDF